MHSPEESDTEDLAPEEVDALLADLQDPDPILVPELARWRETLGPGVRLEDWILHVGDVQFALGYLRLFWPSFVVHEGGVFLALNFSLDNHQGWTEVYPNQPPAIERMLNHTPLRELFQNEARQEEITAPQLHVLGQALQQIWQAKLAQEFPQKRFVVDYQRGAVLADYALTFYQED